MTHKLRRGLIAAVALCAATSSMAAAAGPASAGKKKPSDSSSNRIENPGSASLSETGSTLLYPLWNIWVPAYTQQYPHVSMTTAGTGSGTGITDATNGTVDIGSSDAYLSPSEEKASPSLENIPLAISAQFIAYKLPGITAHIKLNGKVLSAIYQGQITKWNASQIAAINPGISLPNIPIVPLHRSDGSGDTFIFTQYLSKSDPNGWGSKIGYGTTVSWPNVPGALGENGNGGMVSGCKATVGCIAYIGISYLSQSLGDGLGEAQLQNAKGNYLLPSAQTINAEAAGFVSKTPANCAISLVYGPARNGYPIINYEYAIVDTRQSSSSTANAIRSVLQWALSPRYGNGSQYLSQVFFQPLPPAIATKSQKLISNIK